MRNVQPVAFPTGIATNEEPQEGGDTMRVSCGEFVWMTDSQNVESSVDVEVEAEVDIKGKTAKLLSVRPFHVTKKVGAIVQYEACILGQLSSCQVGELEEAMLGHAMD